MNELLTLRKEILKMYYDIKLDKRGLVNTNLTNYEHGIATGFEMVLTTIDERIEELDDAQTEG